MYLWLNGRLRECFGREVNLPFGEPRADPRSSFIFDKAAGLATMKSARLAIP
ncbi:uncharacterized protein PHALS_05134 [Plasmopara halstedii]|uniref:Uncharacterized protein n=1 Tax=Plasmopara halstedii TaxID=4781 RepID=A0A0P1B154_PLAHL|nr:uncharacterized protein PHALS_05134 [Plasmopara halstedii]CEG47799.1 hypothetical protein PHALS_05134 [Plasmopara halstedii]|eukprot:XP_024584168.1 hypothetical protein PHALS_05134 [Plasmopara halstedii]